MLDICFGLYWPGCWCIYMYPPGGGGEAGHQVQFPVNSPLGVGEPFRTREYLRVSIGNLLFCKAFHKESSSCPKPRLTVGSATNRTGNSLYSVLSRCNVEFSLVPAVVNGKCRSVGNFHRMEFSQAE